MLKDVVVISDSQKYDSPANFHIRASKRTVRSGIDWRPQKVHFTLEENDDFITWKFREYLTQSENDPTVFWQCDGNIAPYVDSSPQLNVYWDSLPLHIWCPQSICISLPQQVMCISRCICYFPKCLCNSLKHMALASLLCNYVLYWR